MSHLIEKTSVTVSVKFVDSDGKTPIKLSRKPVWSVEPAASFTVIQAEDGMSCDITPAGDFKPGVYDVTVQALDEHGESLSESVKMGVGQPSVRVSFGEAKPLTAKAHTHARTHKEKD